MVQKVEVRVPGIGNFKDVAIIDISAKVGSVVAQEDCLITLESDKATIDVPSPLSGKIVEICVKPGDIVSEGSLILYMEAEAAAAAPQAPAPQAETKPVEKGDKHAEVLVLGAGPGGYTAAFRAADLGKKVVLVERHASLGGVCLNVGCIPSKALLHVAKVITEAEEVAHHGVKFAKPEIDIDGVRAWKESVVGKLTKGLSGLAKQRKVEVVTGEAKFAGPNSMEVETSEGKVSISFDHAIIAAGSSVAKIPGFPYEDKRIIDSTGALALESVPEHMLVVGGGIIGLEMAAVYSALGAKITVVEWMDSLIPGADRDIVKPLHRHVEKKYEAILLETRVSKMESLPEGIRVTFEGKNAPEPRIYDRVLMAVGRRPNGKLIGAENAGVFVNERGFIPVDGTCRTNVPHIHAIGDIVGEPMLAHKATYEAKIAAEVICGHKAHNDALTIPSVAYTDPEIAWMGLTEREAKDAGVGYEKAVFPWAASGRSLSTGREEGMTKLLFSKEDGRLIGAGMVGTNAGELIAEMVLALEMGADAEDIALTIHPHPTLSETSMFAAEISLGSITDLYMPRKGA
ncbi:MAG: dihydrolipoyl dehydrogenase [Burkholderiales bacterium]|nr:dihydrolipoyl dehydrogenase [Burkholderiales bacterium]